MNILADTGILLRFMEPTDPDRVAISDAIDALVLRSDRLVFGSQNAAEFWSVSTRPKTARGGLGLTVQEASQRLDDLEASFPRLEDDPAIYPNWRLLIIKHAVKGKQVHDAKLVALMNCNGITHIMTLNGADFTRYPGVTIIDPTKP